MTWEEVAADKRERIAASIPSEWRIDTKDLPDNVMEVPAMCGLLSAQELEITNSSAVDLVARLAKGELKAVAVTEAFCKRAAVAHQVVCISVVRGWARNPTEELEGARLTGGYIDELCFGVFP